MIFLERKVHKALWFNKVKVNKVNNSPVISFGAKGSQAKSYGFFWAKSSQGLVYKALGLVIFLEQKVHKALRFFASEKLTRPGDFF